MARIGIAGAGLAGRLAAWALARAGHHVEVVDPAAGPEPVFDGQGAAAFSAAGMLSPLAEQDGAGPGKAALIAAWGWRSIALWPCIAAALRRPPRLSLEGSLLLAHGPDRASAQRALARIDGAEALDQVALRGLEPALAAATARGLHAWLLPGEGLISPVDALMALHDEAPGVRWHWGRHATRVAPGQLTLDDDGRIDCDWAIDMRGLGAREAITLRGVRGETVWLDLPGHGLRRPLRLLHPRHRVYLVPRDERQIVVGASEIESEDRSPVSLQSAVELMAAAHSVLPALGEARILRLDRNLRPATLDHLPHCHCEPGLIRLNGLYRHGWLLAPARVDALLREAGLPSLDSTHANPTR